MPLMQVYGHQYVHTLQQLDTLYKHLVMTLAPALTLNCMTLYNPYNGQAIVSLRWQVQGNENQLAAITGYEVVTTVISMAASEGIFFILQPIALDTLSSNVSNLQVPLQNGHKNCIHVLPSPSSSLSDLHPHFHYPTSIHIFTILPPPSSSQSYLHPHLHNHTSTLIFTILPPPSSSQSYPHPHLHNPTSTFIFTILSPPSFSQSYLHPNFTILYISTPHFFYPSFLCWLYLLLQAIFSPIPSCILFHYPHTLTPRPLLCVTPLEILVL